MDEQETVETDRARDGVDLARRVHTDLPRIRPEDMVTTQDVEPARDPRGGRDTDTEFMLRNAGVL